MEPDNDDPWEEEDLNCEDLDSESVIDSEEDSCATMVQESSDAEICHGTATLLITHDYQVRKLANISKEQTTAAAHAAV